MTDFLLPFIAVLTCAAGLFALVLLAASLCLPQVPPADDPHHEKIKVDVRDRRARLVAACLLLTLLTAILAGLWGAVA